LIGKYGFRTIVETKVDEVTNHQTQITAPPRSNNMHKMRQKRVPQERASSASLEVLTFLEGREGAGGGGEEEEEGGGGL
jgi:hypothetical protein